jgi:hypothetical protein
MATTRIIYSQDGQTGKMLASAVNKWKQAQEEISRVKAILDSASSGSDWGAVAAELGGGITSTGGGGGGQAQDAWTIVSNAKTALDDAALLELARLDQG